MHGADVDHLSGAPAGSQLVDESLCGEEHALEIDVEHLVVVALRHVPERRMTLDAGVVHENVEPTQPLPALLHERSHRRDRSEIALDRNRAAPRRLNSRHGVFSALRIAVVVDDDVRAFFGVANGNRLPDSLAAARNERVRALQPHALRPSSGAWRVSDAWIRACSRRVDRDGARRRLSGRDVLVGVGRRSGDRFRLCTRGVGSRCPADVKSGGPEGPPYRSLCRSAPQDFV